MAVMISVCNNAGHVRRCDAKCYNAVKQKCICVCGGRNHGAGHNQAVANTVNIAYEEIRKTCGEDAGELVVRKAAGQLMLFHQRAQKEAHTRRAQRTDSI